VAAAAAAAAGRSAAVPAALGGRPGLPPEGLRRLFIDQVDLANAEPLAPLATLRCIDARQGGFAAKMLDEEGLPQGRSQGGGYAAYMLLSSVCCI
jgi:hypothetical protein